MCKLQYYCFDSTLLKRTLVITEPIISVCNDAQSECLHIHTEACLQGQGTKLKVKEVKLLSIFISGKEQPGDLYCTIKQERNYTLRMSLMLKRRRERKTPQINKIFNIHIQTLNTHEYAHIYTHIH